MRTEDETAKKMTQAQTGLCLRRVGITSLLSPTLENLGLLQSSFMQNIPFENLDLMAGTEPSLECGDIFHKLVDSQRGGFCLELNALYRWLLDSLGYCTTSFSARVCSPSGGLQMKLHRVTLADIDGRRYITDVGMDREAPRIPLPLEEKTEQTDGLSSYRFERDEIYGWLLWQREAAGAWKRLYSFTEEPMSDADFIPAALFCALHPASPVNRANDISIFTPDTHISVAGDTLRYRRGGRLIKSVPIENRPQMRHVLKHIFGIAIDRAAPAE